MHHSITSSELYKRLCFTGLIVLSLGYSRNCQRSEQLNFCPLQTDIPPSRPQAAAHLCVCLHFLSLLLLWYPPSVSYCCLTTGRSWVRKRDFEDLKLLKLHVHTNMDIRHFNSFQLIVLILWRTALLKHWGSVLTHRLTAQGSLTLLFFKLSAGGSACHLLLKGPGISE